MNREKIRERLTINAIIEHCDRKTRMYEKACDVKYLETAVMGNGIKEYWEHKQVAEYLRKLKDYEDLEEQGRLVKLPCKVGDTVYKADKVREKIKQYKVIHFETDQVDFDNYDYCFLSHFGKTVFLTREEAEAELNSYLKKYNKDVERI